MKLFTTLVAAAYGQYSSASVSSDDAKFATSVFNTMTICNDWIDRALVCQKQGKKLNKYKYRTDRVLKDILWHIIGVKRCNEFNWSGRKRRQVQYDYMDEDLEYEQEYPGEDNLIDLVLKDQDVSMIASADLGFEGAADDDAAARTEFNKIVNHDYQFYQQKIQDVNINKMYEEFLDSKLSDVLVGESDFLSDFVMKQVDEDDNRGYNSNNKVEKARAQCETQLTRLWIKPQLEFCGKLGSWKKRMAGLNNSIYTMQKMCAKKQNYRFFDYEGPEYEAEEVEEY